MAEYGTITNRQTGVTLHGELLRLSINYIAFKLDGTTGHNNFHKTDWTYEKDAPALPTEDDIYTVAPLDTDQVRPFRMFRLDEGRWAEIDTQPEREYAPPMLRGAAAERFLRQHIEVLRPVRASKEK